VISLWDAVAPPGATIAGGFRDRAGHVDLAELQAGSTFGDALESLADRSVLIATHEQRASALALVELDGLARRVVLCTPDLSAAQLDGVAAAAEADAIVVDSPTDRSTPAPYVVSARPRALQGSRRTRVATEWVLLTSGTTGTPKLVLHTLESLAGSLLPGPDSAPRPAAGGEALVWSTFYDIRRYGGLQIYLRAVLTGAPLVLSCAGEPTAEFLGRAAAAGVTHISGTPSHWRRALMSGAAALLSPRYVRLSGEVADQALLDSLRATFPQARVAHAFASTEAGLAFDVDDGLAGFPEAFVGGGSGAVDLKVEDGTLRIRSRRNASRYLGDGAKALQGEDGYVDTGDRVELVGGRYYFRGRQGGVINVGGLKVFPEEVEAVLNAHPRVRMSLVRARRSPITGAVVVADVVLNETSAPAGADDVKQELLSLCRQVLPAHKVPAKMQIVPALELTPAGKLVRPVG